MKNFTNNFKQFTSRLSARWLIMALMLLLGTSSAWAKTVYYVNKSGCSTIKIYFWGGSPSTNWNDSPSMELTDECVKDGDNTYQVYKFDVGTNTSCIFRCDNGQTADLTVDDGKYYYDGWKSKSDLNIVKIEPTTIYFDNSNTGWTSIYLWIGKSTENGGNENYSNGSYQMTRIDNCGEIYKYELYNEWSDATEISFTNTNWGAEGNSICHRYGYLSGNATHIYKTSIADANNIVFKASSTTSKAEINGTYCNCTIGNNQQNNKKFHEFESTETFSQSMCCTAPQASDFKITGVPSEGYYTYNGLEQKPTAEWNNSSNKGEAVTTYISSSSSSYSAATSKNAGAYHVYVTSVAGGNFCDLTTKTYIGSYEIKKASQTALSISNGQTTFCGFPANDIELNVTGGTTSGAVTYSSDNESVATILNNKLHVVAEGTVNVTATMAGNNNYESVTSAAKSFTFYKAPEAPTANQVSNLVKCGDNTENGLITINGYNSEYTYSIEPEATGDAQNGYSIATAGDYVITVTRRVNETCTLSTSSAAITVALTDNTPTIGDITITGAGSFCNRSTTTLSCSEEGDEYQWYKGETPISGETNKTLIINVTETASYKVEVIKTSPCRVAKMSDAVRVTKIDLPTAPALTTNSTNVCPGTLTLSNFKAMAETNTVKWYSNDACTQEIAVQTVEEGQTYTFYAKAINANGCVSEGYSTLTVKVYAKPDDFELSAIPTEICSGADVVISISDKQEGVTYTLGKTEINESITVNPTQTTTYTVVASLDACPNLTTSITTDEITVNPIPSFVTPPSNLSLCKGATNETNLTYLSHVEVTNGSAVWYDAQTGGNKVAGANLETSGTYWVAAENSTTGCINTERKQFTLTINELPKYPELRKTSASLCQSNETEDLDKLAEINDVVWYIGENEVNNAHTISLATAGTTIYTAKAVDANGCQSANGAEFVLTIDAQPTFTAPAATQTNKEVTLTSAAGASTQWSVSPTDNVTLTNNGDGTATFVATANGDYTITASNGVCAQVSHTIKVSDAFYIYFRNAKKGETAYANFYDPNQNTEDVQGGEMFYAECDALPTNGNNSLPTHFVNYNKGGRKADIITTDCDGYTWYGFKASAEVVAGTKYFYVHATNDKNYNGHYTHTVPTKKALTSDVYYTLGTTNHTTTHYGWNIEEASAPYAGPKVYALGSTTLGTDKFAALYVTDCSGKEIKSYQWYNNENVYDSKCEYVTKDGQITGDAGKTNNIRPAIAGNYSCTVTYEDGTTATSAAVEISGSYNRSFTSTIPVLVVNTGDKDFPGCQASGTDNYPSKYAEKLKAKRSVDVKIYDEKGALVYDRKARMAYRGSSSLNFTKKSYAFCPGDANCGDKDKGEDYVKTAKLNMLGVGKACDKDWVLYAAAADPSLMRNRMVFDTYQAMRPNDWGVHSRYVELIINGEYKGVYVFMDKITMNKERVKVDEDNGFIVKFDKTDCADRVEGYNGIFGDQKTFSTERTGRYGISTYHTTVDQLFEIEYPEKDDYPTGWANKVASIKGMFQAFEDALEDGDYATVQKYIDYDSWADWFIINEFTKNLDAYRASCIFVYTGEAGSKIEARPLWDQELSFNNAAAGLSGKGANSTSGLLIQNDGVYTDCFPAPFWFTGQLATFGTCGGNNGSGAKGDKLANCLLNDPCFVQVVKAKWNKHQFDALSADALGKLITKYDDELGYTEKSGSTILDRESDKWPDGFRTSADCSAGGTGYNEVSYSESKTAITNWISDDATKGRRAGLTTALNGLTGASFSIQIIPSEAKTTPWEPVEIAVSVTPAGYDYKLEYTDNDLGSVANTIIKEEGDKITYRIPRPSAWGPGDAEEGERTDIEYGIKATLSVQEGTTVCGSQAAPSSTGKIILQDEDNDNCK